MPHPSARRACGRARHARGRDHRPRLDGGRDRALPHGRQGGHQAAARLRDLPRRRPPRARSTRPSATGTTSRCWPRRRRATTTSSSSARSATSRATTTSRASTTPCSSSTPTGSSRSPAASPGAPARRCSPATRPGRARSSTASCRSSGARTSTSSCRTRASTSTRASTRACSRSRPTRACPVVGTGDVHYLRAEDATPHEALLCIQTNDLLSNPKRFRFSTQDFYLKTADEMSRTMAPWGGDGLLAPTLEIAERCNVDARPRPHPPAALRRGRRRLVRDAAPDLRGGPDASATATLSPRRPRPPRVRAPDDPRDGLRRTTS